MVAKTGSVYIDLLLEVWPLILLAFLISLLQGWRGVKQSYLHKNFVGTFTNIVFSSAVMSVLAVGVVFSLSVFDIEVNATEKLGVVIVLSATGMKGVDAFMRGRLRGYKFLNINDEQELKDMYNSMTPEQQAQHIRQCPFQRDCKTCTVCQGVKNGNVEKTSRA